MICLKRGTTQVLAEDVGLHFRLNKAIGTYPPQRGPANTVLFTDATDEPTLWLVDPARLD